MVTITKDGKRLAVKSPYDAEFVDGAKDLGGKWDRDTETWVFDVRDEAAVRTLARDIYGTDGSDADGARVTIRVPLPVFSQGQEFRVAGMTLASRRYRDSRVQLGDGVVIVEGGFPSKGGSVKNPQLEGKPGTVLEVRDILASVAAKILEEAGGATIVGDAETVPVEELQAERKSVV